MTQTSSRTRFSPSRGGITMLAMALIATVLLTAAPASKAAAQQTVTCFAIADGTADGNQNNEDTADTLVRIDDAGGVNTASIVGTIENAAGDVSSLDAEAMAIRPGDTIYAWSTAEGLFTIDPGTGEANFAAPAAFSGADGGAKVEGLTFSNVDNDDLGDDILWVIRESGEVQGYNVAGAAQGAAVDVAPGAQNGADIAWDPVGDILWAVIEDGNDASTLVRVDGQAGGGATQLDLEGLGSDSMGQLYGTTGNDGTDTLYEVATDGTVSALVELGQPNAPGVDRYDHEDVDCLDLVLPNLDPGVLDATVTQSCPGGDGSIAVEVSYTSGGNPAAYTVAVTGEADASGTLSPNDQPETETFSGLADGMYTVTVTNTTDDPDSQVETANVTIDCDAEGVLNTSVTQECVDFTGTINVRLIYASGGLALDYLVEVTGQGDETGTLNSGDAPIIETYTGLDDGVYNVTVTDTTGDPDDQIGSLDVTINCPGPFPPVLNTAVTQDCVGPVAALNGELSVAVIYASGDIAGDYLVEVTGQADATGTVDPNNDRETETFSGLADGTYTVTVTNVTTDTQVGSLDVTFICDGVPGTIDASAAVACVNGGEDGEITVETTYVSGDNSVNYSIEVTTAATVQGILNSGDPDVTEVYSGLGNATYTVVATNTTDGIVLVDEDIVVSCGDSPGVLNTSVTSECVDSDGTIATVVRFASGDNPLVYEVAVTGQTAAVGTLTPINNSESVTYTNLADGVYTVAVTNVTDGITIGTLPVTIECDPEPGELDIQVVSGCEANLDGTIIVDVIYTGGELPANYTIALTGQADISSTLSPGDEPDVSTYVNLADGTYTLTVTNTSSNEVVGTLDILIFCDGGGFAGFAQAECRADDLGGDIRFVIGNNSSVTRTATVQVEGLPTTPVTVGVSDTEIVVLPAGAVGLADGSYDVEITGLDAPYTDSVEIDCSPDPVATVGDVVCAGVGSLEAFADLTIDNTLVETATQLTVTFDGAATSYSLAAGAAPFTIPLGPLSPGTFPLMVESDTGLTLLTDNIVVGETCFSATPAAVCDAASPTTNIIQVAFVNNGTSPVPVDILVTANGMTFATLTDTIPANFLTTLAPTAVLADGTYDVRVTANGQVVSQESLELKCQNPDIGGTPSAAIGELACPNGTGSVDVDLGVDGGNVAFDFTITVDGVEIAGSPVTVLADGTSIVTVGPLPNEQVVILVTAPGLSVDKTVDAAFCSQPPALSATAVPSACEAPGSTIDVTLSALNGGLTGFFIVSIDDNTFPTQGVPGGTSVTQTYGPFPNGNYAVNVTSLDGTVLLDTVFSFDCTGVTAEAVCRAGNVGSIDFTFTNNGPVDVVFTSTVVGEVPEDNNNTVMSGMTVVDSRGPLPDGTYTIAAAEDGVAVEISNLDGATTVAVDCIVPGDASAGFAGIVCPDTTQGRISLDLTVSEGSIPTDFTVFVDGNVEPNMPLSVDADSTVQYVTALLTPDTYEVEVFADGIADPVFEDEIDVDCTPIITIAKACLNGLGVITTTVTNPANVDVDVVVNITDAQGPLMGTVAAGASEEFVRTGRQPGVYGVEVLVDGVVARTQNVLIETCGDGEPIPPTGPEVMHAVSCLAGNGRVDTNIVNTGADDAVYRVEFAGLSPRENTVAAGDWWRQPITGRQDGSYQVVVFRDGVEVSTTTVTVSCDSSPADVDDDEIRIVNACRANNDGAVNGYILFQFVNDTAAAKGYVIEFQNVPNRSTTAAAFGQAVRAVTGRPDGVYGVTIRSGGEIVESLSVEVDCD